jgi:DNA-binding MarR family transcriptional regulator
MIFDMYIQIKSGVTMKAPIAGVDLTGTGTCAAFNLRRASRVVTQLYDAGLSPTGLKSTQFTILVATAKSQPTSVGALAELTLMDQTTMTRNLRLMVREGLVEVAARGRKRMKLVRLTQAGERALATAVPVWRAMQERFQVSFGAAAWRDLRQGLELAAGVAVQTMRGPRAGVARGDRRAVRRR